MKLNYSKLTKKKKIDSIISLSFYGDWLRDKNNYKFRERDFVLNKLVFTAIPDFLCQRNENSRVTFGDKTTK